MLFTIKNSRYKSTEQLRTDTLLSAYFIIKNYPLHASDVILDKFIQQQYEVSLKNMCIKLLLSISFHKDEKNNLVLLFRDPKYDKIARLITYGNGAIPGSKILQVALNNK
jgi:hypothetical protein